VDHRPVVVELVDAQVVRPLRRAVLRPDQPVENSRYPADDDPSSAHAAISLPDLLDTGPDTVVAVGTVLRDPPPWEPQRVDGWRVRGMATRPDARRRGLGGLVLDELLSHVASHGGGLVWCNARVPAQGLYGRAGFATRGEVFDIAGIGPHMQMWRIITDR
jgi:ribosomal protein S18 acetylase RimI-like enzyme